MKHFHFIGVCGTAMGSVAAAMKARGYRISGSDQNVYPPMSTFLQAQGVEVMKGYRRENITDETGIVVVGNAISRGNEEVEAVLDQRRLYVSLPEVLKDYFLREKRNFVVTGTHGKTTTSSMLTWLMKAGGLDPSHMIGGVPKNFSEGALFTDSEFVVLEGDEYDTAFFDKRSKFLHYLPEVVVVNNIEFDHADIYDSIEEIKTAFRRLLNVVPRSGVAFINGDDVHCLEIAEGAPCPVKRVGLNEQCECRIQDVVYHSDGSEFSLDGVTYRVPMMGEFNVRNAAMAVVAGRFAGLSAEQIQQGLLSFEGIARRQELCGEVDGIKVIDDFAHHPTAIREAILGLRQQYPDNRLWVIFEPRSNTTKRNIFQSDLAKSLSHADLVVVPSLSEPEKVPEEERLNPQKLVEDIRRNGKEAYYISSVDEIVQFVATKAKSGDVVAVLSNGSFDGFHHKLLTTLDQKVVVSA